MSESKHTPGNWGVADPIEGQLTIVANPEAQVYDWLHVAEVTIDGGEGEIPVRQALANAQLITAAPELLALAYMVVAAEQSRGRTGSPLYEAAAAAIAKAEGRRP